MQYLLLRFIDRAAVRRAKDLCIPCFGLGYPEGNIPIAFSNNRFSI